LQRDMVAIARLLIARGHEVTVFAERAIDAPPEGLELRLLPTGAWTNHGRNRRFADAFAAATATGYDRRVGFDKLPGMDVVYCADPSFIARRQHWWQRLSPRYRGFARLERAVFGPQDTATVLALAQPQIDGYRATHGTPAERLILLPPGIDPARRQPDNRRNGTREAIRQQLGIRPDEPLLLWVGAQPRVKGLDRVLDGLAELGRACRLAIVGLTRESVAARRVSRCAQRFGLVPHVYVLGVRDDIPALMAAADLLVHPARLDTTGTVILEALANGLPVLTTDVCGFAHHVAQSGAGQVVPGAPFEPDAFQAALRRLLNDANGADLSAAAEAYAANPEFYAGRQRAAEIIAADDRAKLRRFPSS
jgi:UDP-glucose:(heptosyl)LPS alpha-1,3-glucosyltransferase